MPIVYLLSVKTVFSKEIAVALSSTPSNLVPFYSTDANSQNINRLVHLSLIDFNQKMQHECVACESMKSSMRNGKHVLYFVLRKNLRLSDGSIVDSNSVKNSWEYFAKNQLIKSTFIGAFESIIEFVIIDELRFELVFKKFSLENFSNLVLLKILKLKNGPKGDLEINEIIGGGDYQIQSYSPLEVLLAPRKHSSAKLRFKVVKDETTLALKILNKEIDLSVASLSPRKVEWIRNKKGIRVWEGASTNYQFVGINHNNNFLKDRSVREAISSFIPREKILQFKLKNTGKLSTGMFSPAFGKMHDDVVKIKHDPIKGRELLKLAGLKKNKFGFWEKEGVLFQIDWKVSNNKASIELVELLKEILEREGIKINLSIQEWGTFMSSYKTGKFDLIIGQWIGFTGPEMINFVYHSSMSPPKGGNRFNYKNTEVDSFLDAAMEQEDLDKGLKYYMAANEIINKDFAVISLWHPNIIWIGRECLRNIEVDPFGGFASLKKMETRCE